MTANLGEPLAIILLHILEKNYIKTKKKRQGNHKSLLLFYYSSGPGIQCEAVKLSSK